MIRAVYEREGPVLTLSGHALHAPKGEDIVCAAASILAYTLIEGGAEAEELADGSLRLSGEDRDAFRLIAGGFRLLAYNYPENIRFEVKK